MPPPVPSDSTRGAAPPEPRAKVSATRVAKGKTVDEPAAQMPERAPEADSTGVGAFARDQGTTETIRGARRYNSPAGCCPPPRERFPMTTRLLHIAAAALLAVMLAPAADAGGQAGAQGLKRG